MINTNKLQQHFQHWKEKHFAAEMFYEDGIINESEFNKQSKKILFIAKEPNAVNHESNETYRSFCEEWDTGTPRYGFALRIAEWTHGILNDFPVFDTIDNDVRYASLKKIAFMNLKKSGGKGLLQDTNGFYNIVKDQLDFIKTQIQVIGPDLIVLSISHNETLKELLFPGCNWTDSGYAVKIARYEGMQLIDFYHPSSRNVASAAYSLLQNVVRSEPFN